MNSINIVGRLCAEPERKTTNSGKSVTSINVAVKRPFTKDTTDFIKVVFWEQKCDYICQYGHKGDMVGVSGVLTVRKDEENKREYYEIVASSVDIVGSKKQEQQPATIEQLPQYQAQKPSAQFQQAFEPITITCYEDLPF